MSEDTTSTTTAGSMATSGLPKALSRKERADILASIENSQTKSGIPDFRPGDSVKVHAKIVEGNKERVQIFEGVVIERQGAKGASATFTVRKVSYNVGVERKFFLNSPRIEKIEVTTRGDVRRAKLYYLRGMKGKAGRIKSRYEGEVAGAQASQTQSSSSTIDTGAATEQASA